MEFDNEFEVPAPVDQAWDILMDIQRIAPCVPGAELTEVVDDKTYKGKISVKLGPVALTFNGQTTFEELDAENYSAKLKAICMRTFQIGRRLLAPVLSDQGLARDYRGTRHKNTACYTALHFEHLSATGPTEDALRSPACTLSDACILATVADGRPSAGGAAGPCPGSLRSMIHSV